MGARIAVEVSLYGSQPTVGTPPGRRADEVRKYAAITFPTECGASSPQLASSSLMFQKKYMHERDESELKL